MIVSHLKAAPNSLGFHALFLSSNYRFQRFNYVIIAPTIQIAIINTQSSHDKSSHTFTIPILPLCQSGASHPRNLLVP